MRTTVTLDDDVVAAIDRLRRERSLGLSAALNELARSGLVANHGQQGRHPFRQRTQTLGLRVDVSNVAEAIELLDGPTSR